MAPSHTVRWFAGIAGALGAVALGLAANVYLLNPYPADAGCESDAGYAAIKAHADTNADLAIVILLCAIAGAVVCIAGAVMAAGRRGWFALGVVPFGALCLFSLVLLLASGLYCQN
jgi:hypothetical protein